MSKIQAAMDWAVSIAADSSHGYDQNSRWGPDYDCSSLMISAWEHAGVPVKTNGATYTGNMKYVFLNTGFRDVTKQVNLSTGAGLQAGDVLLHEKNHTAMYLGGGRIVHASINEKGTIKGGAVGDQTGGEICTRSYYNYPWDCVLRYGEEEPPPQSPSVTPPLTQGSQGGMVTESRTATPMLSPGMISGAVLSMQLLLVYKWGKKLPQYGPDGEYGDETFVAFTSFQRDHGLDEDGICGPASWAALIN
jgi:cell wall-associated NlpC family hydrolase